MTLGEIVKAAKYRKRMTQGRAAKKIGISIPILASIEKNKKFIYSDILDKLKSVLDFTEEELEFLEEYRFSPKTEERILKKNSTLRSNKHVTITYHVVIPINFLRELKWKEKEPIYIYIDNKKIVLSKKEGKNRKNFIRNLSKLSDTNYKVSLPWELIDDYKYVPETKVKLTLFLKQKKVVLENNHK